MKPVIASTQFGSITIEGKKFEKDLMIRLDGSVEKRNKNLSKEKFGTSHKVSLEEAQNIYEEGAEKVIIGNGQNGVLALSDEAHQFFRENECEVIIKPTPKAIELWNEATGNVVSMFHLTC